MADSERLPKLADDALSASSIAKEGSEWYNEP